MKTAKNNLTLKPEIDHKNKNKNNMKSSKNNLTLKPDIDLKNKLKNNMYF